MVTPISIKYTTPETLVRLSLGRECMDINLMYYVLVRCDLYLKLELVTIENSDRVTLKWKSTNKLENQATRIQQTV